MGFLLLGGPGETRETAEESLAVADSLHLDTIRVACLIVTHQAQARAEPPRAASRGRSGMDPEVPGPRPEKLVP
jgi:hypothetical protein